MYSCYPSKDCFWLSHSAAAVDVVLFWSVPLLLELLRSLFRVCGLLISTTAFPGVSPFCRIKRTATTILRTVRPPAADGPAELCTAPPRGRRHCLVLLLIPGYTLEEGYSNLPLHNSRSGGGGGDGCRLAGPKFWQAAHATNNWEFYYGNDA